MSTHNIGFYEDLTKIIFQLSSIITKYAPYLFFCSYTVYCNYCCSHSNSKILAILIDKISIGSSVVTQCIVTIAVLIPIKKF